MASTSDAADSTRFRDARRGAQRRSVFGALRSGHHRFRGVENFLALFAAGQVDVGRYADAKMIGPEQRLERRSDLVLNALLDRLAVIQRCFRTLRAIGRRRARTVEEITGRIDQRDLIGRESRNGAGSKLADGGNILWGKRGRVRSFTSTLALAGWRASV